MPALRAFLFWLLLFGSGCNSLPIPDQRGLLPSTSTAVNGVNLQLLGHVSGAVLSVAVKGDYAFLGFSHEFVVLDITDRSHPHWVTSLPLPANDIALADNYAYVVGRNGFAAIDISNPTQPVLQGTLMLPNTPSTLAVAGAHAYAAIAGDLLHIAIDNTASPYLISATKLATRITGLAATADSVYVVSNEGFHWLNMTNSAQPAVLGLVESYTLTYGPVIADGYLYFGGQEGLFMQEISATETARTLIPLTVAGWTSDLAVMDGIAYLASGDQGLRVWDITDPLMPIELEGHHTNSLTLFVVADADYIYAIDYDTALRIFDTTNENDLLLAGNFKPLGLTKSLIVAGEYAYIVAGYNSELHQLAVIPPDQVHTADIHLTDTPLYSLALAGNHLYFVFYGGVGVIDISTSTEPKLIAFYPLPNLWGITAAYPYLYVSDYSGNLWSLDIIDPAHPAEVAYYPLLGYAGRMAVDGELVYLPYKGVGMQIFSLAANGTLTLEGVYSTPLDINKILIADDRAYLALGRDGLNIVDVTDPTAPRLVSRYDTSGDVRDVALQWPYLFVADGKAGLLVLDVSDPARPIAVTSYATPDYVYQVVSANGIIYAVQPLGGLMMFALTASP